jgi:parallel beta-helix repeat protein
VLGGNSFMMKEIIIFIGVLFIVASFFPTLPGIIVNSYEDNELNQSINIVYVDDDFDSFTPGWGVDHFDVIQDGVDAVYEDGIVYVSNGFYYENVSVNKVGIQLIGQDKYSTIIDGSNVGEPLIIKSRFTKICNFTIQNSGSVNWYGADWYIAGVRLENSDNLIVNNVIKNNNLGVFGKTVTNISIIDNDFINDSILFSLYDSDERETYNDVYFDHNIENNTVNGKKIYYFKYQNDVIVPNDAGQVIALGCENLYAKGLNLSDADFPFVLINCSGCKISYSKICNCDGIIWLIQSKNNKILKNNIINNFEGICLDTKSEGNMIMFNNIKYNKRVGLIIEDNSNFNVIYRNNFVGNYNDDLKYQAFFINCFKNIWIKNYWGEIKFLPKIIFSNNFGVVNFDWRPAKFPYVLT